MSEERRSNLASSLQDADEKLKTQLELDSDSQFMPVEVALAGNHETAEYPGMLPGHSEWSECVEQPAPSVQQPFQQQQLQQPEQFVLSPSVQQPFQQQQLQQPLESSSSPLASSRTNGSQSSHLESPKPEQLRPAPMERRPGPGRERELALETMRNSLSTPVIAVPQAAPLATQALVPQAAMPTHVMPEAWVQGYHVDLTPHFNLCSTASRYMGNVDLSVLPPMKQLDLDLTRHRLFR